MAGYGSAGRPVNLGPFQRIVGVHWRDDPPLAFAFRVRLAAGNNGSEDTVSPIYYSPFGYPGFGLYHPDVHVPKHWQGWILTESGWTNALSYSVAGMPEFGEAPYYSIGTPVSADMIPISLNMRWDVNGAPLDFVTPIIGQGDTGPRNFLDGTASVIGASSATASLTLPTDITALVGVHKFAYAGAVPLMWAIGGGSYNVLIDHKELIILCLPVTEPGVDA